MEAKHTPGPWTMRDEGTRARVWCDSHVIADCRSIFNGPDGKPDVVGEEVLANARLIAAAPALAEALRAILDMPENLMRVDTRITSAREILDSLA